MRTVSPDSPVIEGVTRWDALSEGAWACREHSHVLGKTRVGAAILAQDDALFYGCNVEHQFRSHDVHAEVNAITTMVSAGHRHITAILIVADRSRFTPCGACMDWVFQFGGGACLVGFQQRLGGTIDVYRADELMPHYPV